MAKNRSFDFGKLQRSFYTTRLKDGRTIIVNMPKKSTFEAMNKIEEIEDTTEGKEMFHEVAALMAEILSNNKTKVRITPAELEEDYDLEEMIEYFKDYAKFVEGLKTDPN